MGRQSLKIDRNSVNSANHLRLYMADNPTESETIVAPQEEEQSVDPVSEFKKGKAKREAKRKEVKVITEYVPDPPVPAAPLSSAIEVPPAVDAESIAGRVAEMLFEKMAVEKNDLDKTPEIKTKAKAKPPARKKEVPPPPPTKYFGWC